MFRRLGRCVICLVDSLTRRHLPRFRMIVVVFAVFLPVFHVDRLDVDHGRRRLTLLLMLLAFEVDQGAQLVALVVRLRLLEQPLGEQALLRVGFGVVLGELGLEGEDFGRVLQFLHGVLLTEPFASLFVAGLGQVVSLGLGDEGGLVRRQVEGAEYQTDILISDAIEFISPLAIIIIIILLLLSESLGLLVLSDRVCRDPDPVDEGAEVERVLGSPEFLQNRASLVRLIHLVTAHFQTDTRVFRRQNPGVLLRCNPFGRCFIVIIVIVVVVIFDAGFWFNLST